MIYFQKIENLMNLVGELVLKRNRLLRLYQSMTEEGLSKKSEELEVVVSSIDSDRGRPSIGGYEDSHATS